MIGHAWGLIKKEKKENYMSKHDSMIVLEIILP
jgi:hypothetical protein